MKKFDWGTVAEIAVGFIIGGIVVAALSHLFGGWLAKQGALLHGSETTGADAGTK